MGLCRPLTGALRNRGGGGDFRGWERLEAQEKARGWEEMGGVDDRGDPHLHFLHDTGNGSSPQQHGIAGMVWGAGPFIKPHRTKIMFEGRC
jgi:hypothetical protein